jgi:hypothetical protein
MLYYQRQCPERCALTRLRYAPTKAIFMLYYQIQCPERCALTSLRYACAQPN